MSIYCSKCGAEVPEDVNFCSKCGAVVAKIVEESKVTQPTRKTIGAYSYKQPVWHLVVLSLVTFGLYEIYWFYKTWRAIKNYTGANFSPGWRTFGLFIPFYNLVRIDGMFRYDVALVRTKVDGAKFIRSPLAYGLAYILPAVAAWKLPDPFWILSFLLSILPLALVQKYLNFYWTKDKEQNVLPERKKLFVGEIILIILGIVFWLLVLIGLFLPE